MSRLMDVHDMHREQIRKEGERAERKAKIKFTIKWFGIGLVIGFIATWLTSCGIVSETPATQETTVTESVSETVMNMPETEETVTPSEAVTESTPAKETETAHEAPAATWHASTKNHDITVDSILAYGDGVIWNFSNCTAVGTGVASNITVATEADYGFIVTVIDNDTVEIKMYNNSAEHIVPVKVTAELSTGNLETTENYESYGITGYGNCTNGFGTITVSYSNGRTLIAGVFKENDRLYAVNINEKNTSSVTDTVNCRLNLAKLMNDACITEKNAVSTDNIYYPIVPVAKTDTTDADYWIAKSSELVEDDWTNAHKVMAFYNYAIDNFAYDNWVVSQNGYGRCFHYKDYSGKYYISQTNIGVCEDFSQVIAIMCRAQGIPALDLANGKHAIAVVYISDYGRWIPIDTTSDIENDVYQEDFAKSKWTKTEKERYAHLGYAKLSNPTKISIGNSADMEKFGIPMFQ